MQAYSPKQLLPDVPDLNRDCVFPVPEIERSRVKSLGIVLIRTPEGSLLFSSDILA